jgi:hypothetical protein
MTQLNAAIAEYTAEAARVSRLHPLDPAKRGELRRVLAQKKALDEWIARERA